MLTFIQLGSYNQIKMDFKLLHPISDDAGKPGGGIQCPKGRHLVGTQDKPLLEGRGT